MENNKSNSTKISALALISVFKQSAKQGYNLLISGDNNKNLYSNDFWSLFKQEYEQISDENPENQSYVQRTLELNYFFELNEIYSKAILETQLSILEINPSQQLLFKTLLLAIELRDSNDNYFDHQGYDFKTLASVKKCYATISKKTKRPCNNSYSLDLFNKINYLISLYTDQLMLDEFRDLFLWSEFDLIPNLNGIGYSLRLGENKSKMDNFYILNELKNIVKRNIKENESNNLISVEQHFLKIDPILKTKEGLATIFHSSGIRVNEQTKGTTSLKIEDEIFDKIVSEDIKEREAANTKLMTLVLEQNFHVRYRAALAQIFQPNDEINVHTSLIKLNELFHASLFEIFAALSSLIAVADICRYMQSMPNSEGIEGMRRIVMDYVKSVSSELAPNEIQIEANKYIANYLDKIEDQQPVFTFHTQDFFISIFKKIDELKSKSEEELNLIFNLFCDENGKMPFLPIFKVNEQYYFSYKTYLNSDLNRILYDYFITKELYSNSAYNTNNAINSKRAKQREANFNNGIENTFKLLTPFVVSNVQFKDPTYEFSFEGIDGEFDVVAYFKEENVLMPIQVKLSNSTLIGEAKVNYWITNNIKNKAAQQVNKDLTILRVGNGDGLKYISRVLEIGYVIPIDVKIFPLIITDNFYADHMSFPYDLNNSQVKCISYFELSHIITKTPLNTKQSTLFEKFPQINAYSLMDIIENNLFWKFLDEKVETYSISKSLSIIDEAHRISLVI